MPYIKSVFSTELWGAYGAFRQNTKNSTAALRNLLVPALNAIKSKAQTACCLKCLYSFFSVARHMVSMVTKGALGGCV